MNGASRPLLAATDDDPQVAARRAQLLALPLREEPETEEERALFDRAAVAARSGRRGRSAQEIHDVIAGLPFDHGG